MWRISFPLPHLGSLWAPSRARWVEQFCVGPFCLPLPTNSKQKAESTSSDIIAHITAVLLVLSWLYGELGATGRSGGHRNALHWAPWLLGPSLGTQHHQTGACGSSTSLTLAEKTYRIASPCHFAAIFSSECLETIMYPVKDFLEWSYLGRLGMGQANCQ